MTTICWSGLLRARAAAIRQHCTTPVILIATLGLILSDGLAGSPFSPASGVVRATGSAGGPLRNSPPLLAKTRAPRKPGRQQGQRHTQQAHTPKRAKADRKQAPNQKGSKRDRKPKHKKKDRSDPGAGSSQSVENHYIVVLKPSAGDPERAADAVAAESADVTITQVYEHAIDGFAAVIPDDQLDEVRNDPQVQAVVPDEEVQVFGQTLPTGINRIAADQNATAKIDGRQDNVDVDVAVLDTGIGPHPDLNVVGGISCADGITSYDDDGGHGTHVAGTIGALDNSVGVVGVAPGTHLWAVKVLHSDGQGLTSEVICGLDWVAANSDKIDVVNMSLGKTGSDSPCPGDDPLHNAVCRVVDVGVTVVVSAGNSSSDAANFRPATFDEVITVSALADSDGLPGAGGAATAKGPDDSLANFSNFGADVDIAAPGVDILSTINGGYGKGWGTSMASPHVAGAAALFLASHPGANPAEVKRYLLSTREDIALPNDPDGTNEGVLLVGDGYDPTPPTANPAPPAPAKKKNGKHKKGGGKKGGGKKR